MENTIAFLARFPMPAIVLSAVLTLAHLTLRVTDWPSGVLFLQPANTVTRPHQVLTAGLFEDSAPSLLVAVPAVLLSAKVLAPEWGDRETVRFLVLVNVLHACATWLCMILLYVLFREEHFLFARLGCANGLLGGLSVAMKQQQLGSGASARTTGVPPLDALVALAPLAAIVWSLLLLLLTHAGPPDEIFFPVNGVLVGWAYLRYYQPRADGTTGDSAADFAFASLFPAPLQPPLHAVGTAIYGVLSSCCCGLFPPPTLSIAAPQTPASTGPFAAWMSGGLHLEGGIAAVTTHDAEVAERRRQRARAMLEERFAAKLASREIAPETGLPTPV